MDLQPSIRYDPKAMNIVDFAAFLLPTEEYSTTMTVFPGAFALENYATQGDFFITFDLFSQGKKIGEVHSDYCTHTGHLRIEFDEFTRVLSSNIDALLIGHYHHTSAIPIELYMSHIHKPTGTYIAYPALPFMGDELFPQVHSQQLENTLFWPGMPLHEDFEMAIAVANPFKVSFSYQFSLFFPDGQRLHSEVLKLGPRRFKMHPIEKYFPDGIDLIKKFGGRCGLCVAAQYKIIAYTTIKHRQTGAITTMDHFHTYCMV